MGINSSSQTVSKEEAVDVVDKFNKPIAKIIAIVMPMGTGKTTLCKRFHDMGFIDVDEARTDKAEDILSGLRLSAAKTHNWDIHDRLWFAIIDEFLRPILSQYPYVVVFTHSEKHAKHLKAITCVSIKLSWHLTRDHLNERIINYCEKNKMSNDAFEIYLDHNMSIGKSNWRNIADDCIVADYEEMLNKILDTICVVIRLTSPHVGYLDDYGQHNVDDFLKEHGEKYVSANVNDDAQRNSATSILMKQWKGCFSKYFKIAKGDDEPDNLNKMVTIVDIAIEQANNEVYGRRQLEKYSAAWQISISAKDQIINKFKSDSKL